MPDTYWNLSDVIVDICGQAGIPESRVDVSELDMGAPLIVRGVPLSPAAPAADTITAMCDLFQVSISNVGGVLQFRRKGGLSVADISDVDTVDDGGPTQEAKRRDRIEIPKQLIFEYYDFDGGLNPDTQISTRALDSRAVSEVKRKTSVILTALEAARLTQVAHKVLIEEQRGEWTFSLPDSYLALTVGDIVTFEGHRLRITETEVDEGFQSYKAVHDRRSAYTSTAVPKPPGNPGTPPSLVIGATVLHFIDSHIIRDADDRLGYYVAITGVGDAWQGAFVELSTDGGDTYPDSIEVGTDAISGYLEEPLPTHSRYYPDTVNTLEVDLLRDDMELESATLAQMMNRRNLAIVGDELINFGDVEEDSQGHWQLTNLLRGRKGSPIEAHPAETRFVLMERQQLWFLDADLVDLGEELTFRVTSLGSQNSDTQTVTFTGRSQTERRPHYLTAERDGGNVAISWQGVGRLGGGVHVAMGAFFEHYRVTVNSTNYTTTDQQMTISDPGGLLEVEVRQINSLTGAGPAATVTL